MEESRQKRELLIDLADPNLLEMLAELEHRQWAHWIKYQVSLDVCGHLTDEEWTKWELQAGSSYANLSEDEKESDREWARKVVDTISKWWWRQH